MVDDEDYDEEDRPDRVRSVVLTGLVALALLAVLVAVGTTIVVRSLGLDDTTSGGPVGAGPSASPLPSTALPSLRGRESETQSTEPSELPSAPKTPNPRKGAINLSVSPVLAKPMERVNLTGTYPGHDNVGLVVQRWAPGGWEDFGVSTTVRVGTFETYVMTGQRGDNRFRMYDPEEDKGSNVVIVTID